MYININDPRDPWAWRNKWTGESRYGNDDLWIWITLCVLLIILAIIAISPLLMLKYCRGSCPCDAFFNWFEKFLYKLHYLGRKKNKNGFRRFHGNVKPSSRRIIRSSKKSPRNVNIYYVGRGEEILGGRKYRMSERRTTIPKINLSSISS
uniref:4Fe-4S ferredoxin-type domain-containing protein n=1 Tax=Strongyloides stercoralis TaxID=6248 RepID=A0A0K0EIS9_STRER